MHNNTTNLNYKVDRKNHINVADDDRDRVPGAVDVNFSDDKGNVQNDEKEGKDSEVNVFNDSSQFPVEELLVTTLHWRSGRVVAF